eukprot:TRINITY_DN40789_c0_g1_i1.p1 TRINITY_DN40789_c0_g1~~TRINITY_DN40789_c0_g1_i1.p1  ORF type:complete len:355 (-),score=160.08 TRINITY_DN40789_c0_g1_i1:72-1106(-)
MKVLGLVLLALVTVAAASKQDVVVLKRTANGDVEPVPSDQVEVVVAKHPKKENDVLDKAETECPDVGEPETQSKPKPKPVVCPCPERVCAQVHEMTVHEDQPSPPSHPIVVVGGSNECPAGPEAEAAAEEEGKGEEDLTPAYFKGIKDARALVLEEFREKRAFEQERETKRQEIEAERIQREEELKLEKERHDLAEKRAQAEAQAEFWASQKEKAKEELEEAKLAREKICVEEEANPADAPCPCLEGECEDPKIPTIVVEKKCCASPTPPPPCPEPSPEHAPPAEECVEEEVPEEEDDEDDDDDDEECDEEDEDEDEDDDEECDDDDDDGDDDDEEEEEGEVSK